MVLPSPPQVGHTDVVCICPSIVLVSLVTCPEPWHVEQVDKLEASAAPVPPQESQVSYLLTLIFFSVPAAISWRLSLTLTLRLLPLLTLRPRLVPPKAPNPPKASPKISPNDENMSSIVIP